MTLKNIQEGPDNFTKSEEVTEFDTYTQTVTTYKRKDGFGTRIEVTKVDKDDHR